MRNTAKPVALIRRERVPLNERIALSIDDAAAVSDLSRSTIKKLIREGKLPVSRKTGRTLINPIELRRFLFGDASPSEGE